MTYAESDNDPEPRKPTQPAESLPGHIRPIGPAHLPKPKSDPKPTPPKD